MIKHVNAGTMNDKPLINVLIRTSNRPKQFAECLESVYAQNYPNIRIIVSVDNETALKYVPDNLEILKLKHSVEDCKRDGSIAFYNKYCNVLKQWVDNGYFFFLDDDDLLRPGALLDVCRYLNEDRVLIVQMNREGRKKPLNKNYIKSGHIGICCAVVPAKFKNVASFDGSIDADYRWIKELITKIPWKFVPTVLVNVSKRGMGVV